MQFALIEELYLCAAQCARCYDISEKETEVESLRRCMMYAQDCEEMCYLTAQVMERESENSSVFLELCAKLCDTCAEECDKHRHLLHCRNCAAACRKGAEICRQQLYRTILKYY